MKETIKKVLEKYEGTQINLDSEVARELLAEDIYREVGNFLEWWGKKPDIRYKVVDDAGVDVDTGKYVGD